jgi:RimJ/RimL family protein N-acetyltransferase
VAEIVTERLILRRFRATDLPAFIAYRSDPDVARYQGWDASFSIADAVRFLAEQDAVALGMPGAWTQLAAADRVDGTLHGDCAACISADDRRSAEIGVTVAPASQGRGYATEALTALLTTLCDEHGVERVQAQCHRRNSAVHALLERVGLQREGITDDPDWLVFATRRS